MGITTSAPNTEIKKYSDEDIRNNIIKLCKDALSNNDDNITESIKGLYDADLNDTFVEVDNSNIPFFVEQPYKMMDTLSKPLTGGNIKFKSSKQRHLNHNINNYINNLKGGNVDDGQKYEEISDNSELEKIKNYLMNDLNKQYGGAKIKKNKRNNNDDDDFNDMESDVIQSDKKTLSRALFDIINDGDSDDMDDSYINSDDDLNIDDSSDDIGIDDAINELDDTDNIREPSRQAKYSTTSDIKDDESELHIFPFYSSDVENQHPYIKNRFNH